MLQSPPFPNPATLSEVAVAFVEPLGQTVHEVTMGDAEPATLGVFRTRLLGGHELGTGNRARGLLQEVPNLRRRSVTHESRQVRVGRGRPASGE